MLTLPKWIPISSGILLSYTLTLLCWFYFQFLNQQDPHSLIFWPGFSLILIGLADILKSRIGNLWLFSQFTERDNPSTIANYCWCPWVCSVIAAFTFRDLHTNPNIVTVSNGLTLISALLVDGYSRSVLLRRNNSISPLLRYIWHVFTFLKTLIDDICFYN